MKGEESKLTDVTIVLVAQEARADRVSLWLPQLAADPELADTPVVVLLPQGMAAGDIDIPAENLGVRLVPAPTGTSTPDDDFTRLMATITTPYVAAVTPPGPRTGYLAALKKSLRGGRRLWEGSDAVTPRLLVSGNSPLQVVGPYLSWLSRRPDHDALALYGARLALRAGVATLEGVDPAEGAIELLLRLNLGPTSFPTAPSWRFCAALTGPDGEVARSEPAPLTARFDRHATSRFERLRVRLPLSGTPTAEHRLTLTSPDLDGVGVPREVRPSAGTLLGSRTVTLDCGGETVRYLVHTRGNGRATHLTTQTGSGPLARLSWRWRLLKQDARFVLAKGDDRQMRMLRLLRLVTAPLFAGRPVWLVGERADTAQDNGVHFFRHLRTVHPRRRVYYLIDDESPHIERVRPLGNVVRHSSLRHRLLMLHAAVLADAYSIHYLVPRQWEPTSYARRLAWRVGALRVYLKHGVHLSPHALQRGPTGYDVLLTVNERESEALRSTSGYSRQIVEVGLPRYDKLVPTPSSRTILFMTTWRRYLVPKPFGGGGAVQVPFEGSTYERFITSVLTSPRLQALLEEHDYTLRFLPHYNVAEHFQAVRTAGPRVTVADVDQVSFQELLRECDAFVTDYSSVQFDIAYLGTPTIYTHFDRAEYDDGHAAPSWFDFAQDGFGPVTHTQDELLDELENLLARGCRLDPFYSARAQAAFTYRDQDNSRRAVAAIEARLDR